MESTPVEHAIECLNAKRREIFDCYLRVLDAIEALQSVAYIEPIKEENDQLRTNSTPNHPTN